MKEMTRGFVYLGDLVDFISEYLTTAPLHVRLRAAKLLYVDPRSGDLLEALKLALDDPYLSGHKIAMLGSAMLCLIITYQEDSVVYIADPDDPKDTADRAMAKILSSLNWPVSSEKTAS